MNQSEFPNQILAVICLYRMPLPSAAAWASLNAEAELLRTQLDVFVYDNSPASQTIVPSDNLRCHYTHDPSNAGASTAFNAANRLALRMGKRWLLLLDQDTGLPPGALEAYRDAILNTPDAGILVPQVNDSLGILSPFVFRLGSGVRLRQVQPGPLPLTRFRAINSGLLIRCSLFEAAGGYEESVPLDFSDLVFLERVSRIERVMHRVAATLTTHFSGNERAQPDSTLERFRMYCRGAIGYSRISGDWFWLPVRTFVRAMRLSLIFGKGDFLKVAIGTWLK